MSIILTDFSSGMWKACRNPKVAMSCSGKWVLVYFLCVNPEVALSLAKSCWCLKLAAEHRLCSKRSIILSWELSMMGNFWSISLRTGHPSSVPLLLVWFKAFIMWKKESGVWRKYFQISLSLNQFSNGKTKSWVIWEERSSSSSTVPSCEPSPGAGCVLSSACSAQDTPGLFRGLNLESRWEFPGRREEMETAAAPISFVLAATTHSPESHGPPLPSPSSPFISLPSFCRQEETNVHLESHWRGSWCMNSLPSAPLNPFLLHLFVLQIKLHSSVWRKV